MSFPNKKFPWGPVVVFCCLAFMAYYYFVFHNALNSLTRP